MIDRLHHRPEYELYDRQDDPNELVNQIDNPAYAQVLKRLKDRLHQRRAEFDDSDPMSTETKIREMGRKKPLPSEAG